MAILSVLDQSPIREGGTPMDAIHETLELAERVERLGYHRYWLAEHHGSPGLAGTAPEILIGQIAARTSTMRVGSGGVMLNHYSSFKVAENFRLLETLYPGRIDLGIGRAPGGTQLSMIALQHGPGSLGIEHFPRQLHDLFGFLGDTLTPDHPFARLHANPAGPTVPEVWLLGSSDQSAAYPAHFGKAFSFPQFIVGEGGPMVMQAYREHFKPSSELAEPHGSIGVHVVCADTEEAADRLAMSRDLWRLRMERGQETAIPSVETAVARDYNDAERARVAYHRQRQIIGAPEQVKAKLEALGEAYGVDEFVVVTVVHDFAARIRSYELLAEIFGIAPGDRSRAEAQPSDDRTEEKSHV